MEGYTLEGTKKTGMSRKQKSKVLEEVKAASVKASSPTKAAAPKKK